MMTTAAVQSSGFGVNGNLAGRLREERRRAIDRRTVPVTGCSPSITEHPVHVPLVSLFAASLDGTNRHEQERNQHLDNDAAALIAWRVLCVHIAPMTALEAVFSLVDPSRGQPQPRMEIPMNKSDIYITTSIPYVNAAPHVGFSLELVQADAYARHYRLLGHDVRFQCGTDDNSLKNVRSAEAAGIPVEDFVNAYADRFERLGGLLDTSNDEFVRTSRDPRHVACVHGLWKACAASGDLYRKAYEGLYCVECEQFYESSDLNNGRWVPGTWRSSRSRQRGKLVLPAIPLWRPNHRAYRNRRAQDRSDSSPQRSPRPVTARPDRY